MFLNVFKEKTELFEEKTQNIHFNTLTKRHQKQEEVRLILKNSPIRSGSKRTTSKRQQEEK
jgi:hypothetical protein